MKVYLLPVSFTPRAVTGTRGKGINYKSMEKRKRSFNQEDNPCRGLEVSTKSSGLVEVFNKLFKEWPILQIKD